jgi:hypothetical protein
MMRLVGQVGSVWGALGVLGMLLFAIYRLTPKAVAAYEMGLSPWQWLIATLFCGFMAYSEGYRGFQVRFSPRTAARIRYLRDRPNLLRSLLAPLFSMGFFHATRRLKVTAYALTTGIVILVVLVHRLDQPWRGIIDMGVVIGLAWGVLTLGAFIVKALTRPSFEPSPEVPQPAGE